MSELEMNPYVVQIDKFVTSLGKLSDAFLNLEEKRTSFTEEEYQEICDEVRERACKHCERKEVCFAPGMLREVLATIENYGAELNIELKRKMQKKCVRAPKFLRTAIDVYKTEKQRQAWKQRMLENRQGCAVQLDTFAKSIRRTTNELDASIFEEEHLEKKMKLRLTNIGLKLLTTDFFVTKDGRYEINVTVKATNGESVSTKDVAKVISECTGRKMVLGK